jgi:hypothetical protein
MGRVLVLIAALIAASAAHAEDTPVGTLGIHARTWTDAVNTMRKIPGVQHCDNCHIHGAEGYCQSFYYVTDKRYGFLALYEIRNPDGRAVQLGGMLLLRNDGQRNPLLYRLGFAAYGLRRA